MPEDKKLVEGCLYTGNGYGHCEACFCADFCPTYLGTGAERAYVDPDGDHALVLAVR